MKKLLPVCLTISAVCVLTMILVVLFKEDESVFVRIVEAVVYTFIVVYVAGISFFVAKNPDVIARYGLRKGKGKFQIGKSDYTTMPEQRRMNVAWIVTLVLSIVMLCVALFC